MVHSKKMTSLKCKNYSSFLTANGYKVETINETEMTYICFKNHTTNIGLTSFANKKALHKDNVSFLCTECKSSHDKEVERQKLDAVANHEIIHYNGKEDVDFICNNCGYSGKSTKKALLTSKNCIRCLNDKNRKPYSALIASVEENGMKLLTTEKEYTNNKNIKVICHCGQEWRTSLADVRRGRQCGNCKVERSVITNNDRYGVDNPMHYDEFFRKKAFFGQKDYTFRNGNTIKVMGYEDLVLKELEESNLYKTIYAGNHGKIPTFFYELDGKKHKYYPDIYLPETKTLIEVKSCYWFNFNKEREEVNAVKAKEVSKTYNFLWYVIDEKKNRVIYKWVDNKFVEL